MGPGTRNSADRVARASGISPVGRGVSRGKAASDVGPLPGDDVLIKHAQTVIVTECDIVCHHVQPGGSMSKRYNIQLDAEHAAKLETLAERTHIPAGTLARSLLSTAIDEANPSPSTVVDILDAIPGAFERHQQGIRDAREGKSTALEDL